MRYALISALLVNIFIMEFNATFGKQSDDFSITRIVHSKTGVKLGMVEHTYNLRTQNSETEMLAWATV